MTLQSPDLPNSDFISIDLSWRAIGFLRRIAIRSQISYFTSSPRRRSSILEFVYLHFSLLISWVNSQVCRFMSYIKCFTWQSEVCISKVSMLEQWSQLRSEKQLLEATHSVSSAIHVAIKRPCVLFRPASFKG